MNNKKDNKSCSYDNEFYENLILQSKQKPTFEKKILIAPFFHFTKSNPRPNMKENVSYKKMSKY